MKIKGIELIGLSTEDIIDTLRETISTRELQNWINDRLDEYNRTSFDLEDVDQLLRFIAESLTHEDDL